MPINITESQSYLDRRLEYLDPAFIMRTFVGLPFDNGQALYSPEILPWGVESIYQEIAEFVGETLEFTNDLTDVPFVQVSVGEESYKVQYRTLGYRFTLMEMEKEALAAKNGQQLVDKVAIKNKAIARIFSEYGNYTGAYGVPERGMSGALNDPNVPINNSNIDFGTATDNEIVDFFTDEITSVEDQLNLAGEPNVIHVPKKLQKRICQIKPNDNWSVEQSILKTNKSISVILPYNEGRSDQLEKFGVQPAGTNKGRIWIHRLDNEVVKRLKSRRWRLPTEYRDGGYNVLFVQAFAQTQYVEPLTAKYVTYDNF